MPPPPSDHIPPHHTHLPRHSRSTAATNYPLFPKIPIDPPNAVGVLSSGNHLTHVSFVAGQEAITSEAGYPTSLKGTWVHGSDYIKTDADGAQSRLEVDSLVKDTATGGLVRYKYTGVVDMSRPAGKVLRGEADAATTDFGHICEYIPLCVRERETMCVCVCFPLV